jgi:hypothetical protein
VGSAPTGFVLGRTGQGREGRWLVRNERDAPSGSNVLVQTDADATDHRFPIAYTAESFPADLDLRVKCRPVSGKGDRACGMVLRLKDASKYYVTRANALEGNIRLCVVKDGGAARSRAGAGR